ncbi:Ribonuclease G [hydrothermal vent metagenome]|uniref:Ribonuclease G n=1 Tax=hydrothermal vent metagenome TaxID=652676 RepID=A0A3B1D657_9ZZZZ
MAREILIQTQKSERLVAIIENGRVDDFHIELDSYQSLLGNIYKGKVTSILPSINAAFVNIGQERNGFLYLTDAVNPLIVEELSGPRKLLEKIFKRASNESAGGKNLRKGGSEPMKLKVGQEVLVQVVKDPFREKGARLTTHISLPGRFVVYMPCDQQAGVSRKIENVEERRRLREVIKGFAFAKMGGFIIRTASRKQGKRELTRDAKFLYELWLKVYKKSETEKAPALIYEEGELTWKIVRDYLTEKVDKLVIDSAEEHLKIQKFVQTLIGKQMVSKIHHYKGHVPLFEARKITKELQTIYETNVYCKSGAYVVIEPTEGVTVIDVNSGKFKTKASPGEAAFMVNMEVVPEIARQLRLRDLGGIIVIDFIDMVQESHKRRVVEALRRAVIRDPAKTEVNRISSLGLVEMTRARTGKTVESISFGKCPFCEGRGRVRIG